MKKADFCRVCFFCCEKKCVTSRYVTLLKYKGDGEVIGRSVSRNSEVVENVTNAKIILKKDENGGFILTGYPVK
ncbi:hypothetical protein B9G52_07580 [Bacillus safensis]|nr:hypothetical protein [Bacillus safensis]